MIQTLTLDQIISQCNSDNIRKAVGKILVLSESDIVKVLAEYERKCDMRFGDNLIYACGIVKRLREDWNYSAIFRDY